MKYIICLEKNNGMLFFNKRHSQDSLLREHILGLVGENNLFMSNYSKKQFEESSKIIVDDNYVKNANSQDYAFVEDMGFDCANADEFILCKWNRKYPSDKFFSLDLSGLGYKKCSTENIKGSSHDKITIERYIKNG